MAKDLSEKLSSANCFIPKDVSKCLSDNDVNSFEKLILDHFKTKACKDQKAQELSELLYAAVFCGASKCVDWLISQGVEPNLFGDRRKRTSLHIASYNGRADLLQKLLETGADPNQPDLRGATSLILSARRGHFKCLLLLLDRGARTDPFVTIFHHNALTEAAENGHLDCIKSLLDAGADIESEKSERETPLILAAQYGHLDCVKELVARGANVFKESSLQHTALFHATKFGRFEIVKYLLEHDSRLEKRDESGHTVLAVAASNGDMQLVQLFMGRGASFGDVRDLESVIGECACRGNESCLELLLEHAENVPDAVNKVMINAVSGDKLKCVELLLKHGANPNFNTIRSIDNNLLHEAAQYGSKKCLRFILSQKVDVNARSTDGRTAVIYAAERGEPDCMTTLIAHGADVHVTNNKGMTAIMVALGTPVLKVLCKAGVDVNAQCHSGMTALMHYCVDSSIECIPMMQYLIKCGAEINTMDFQGRTAAMYAAMNGRSVCLNFLMDRGADVSWLDHNGLGALEHCVQHGLSPRYKNVSHKAVNKCIETLLSRMPQSLCTEETIQRALSLLLLDRAANWSTKIQEILMKYIRNFLESFFKFKEKFPCILSWCIDEFASIAWVGEKAVIRFLLLNGVYPKNGVTKLFNDSIFPINPGVLKYFIFNSLLTSSDLERIKAHKAAAAVLPEFQDEFAAGAGSASLPDAPLEALTSQPWPLVKICLLEVSTILGNSSGLKSRVEKCGLPPKIQRFLTHENECLKLCPSQWDLIPIIVEPAVYNKLPRPRPLLEQWPTGQPLEKCKCDKCCETGLKFQGHEFSVVDEESEEEPDPLALLLDEFEVVSVSADDIDEIDIANLNDAVDSDDEMNSILSKKKKGGRSSIPFDGAMAMASGDADLSKFDDIIDIAGVEAEVAKIMEAVSSSDDEEELSTDDDDASDNDDDIGDGGSDISVDSDNSVDSEMREGEDVTL